MLKVILPARNPPGRCRWCNVVQTSQPERQSEAPSSPTVPSQGLGHVQLRRPSPAKAPVLLSLQHEGKYRRHNGPSRQATTTAFLRGPDRSLCQRPQASRRAQGSVSLLSQTATRTDRHLSAGIHSLVTQPFYLRTDHGEKAFSS